MLWLRRQCPENSVGSFWENEPTGEGFRGWFSTSGTPVQRGSPTQTCQLKRAGRPFYGERLQVQSARFTETLCGRVIAAEGSLMRRSFSGASRTSPDLAVASALLSASFLR